MFGGHDSGDLGNNNQVWAFELAQGRWTRLSQGDVFNAPASGVCDFPPDFTNVDLKSPERRGFGAFASDGQGRAWLFGGKTDCGNADDVWSLDLGATVWTEQRMARQGEMCVRNSDTCEGMCR